jgi:hypothetical protein
MKRKILAIVILSSIILSNCSSDNDQSNSMSENIKYLKSDKSDNIVYPGDYDHFFEYENGYLTHTSTGNTNINNTIYSYDTFGKLISKQNYNGYYAYVYDNQNRLIKEVETGTNNYTSLTYGTNKITLTRYYEYSGGSSTENFEQTLDNSGRIIKHRRLTPATYETSMLNEYIYDNNGNISEVRFKEDNYGYPDRIVYYQYDNKPNPYFYSLKKINNSIYYLKCLNGLSNYEFSGFTPNNMTIYGSTTYSYTYDEVGYPKTQLKTYYDGSGGTSTTGHTFEYY